jgi:hypothetical protein
MYAEAGSLRKLRSEIRRAPEFDPALEMISGQSLFLFDQREGIGPGTALFYRKHSARLQRGFDRAILPAAFDDPRFARDLLDYVSPSARTLEGDSVLEVCERRAGMMVNTLLRSLPATPAWAATTAAAESSTPQPQPAPVGTP